MNNSLKGVVIVESNMKKRYHLAVLETNMYLGNVRMVSISIETIKIIIISNDVGEKATL